MLKAGLQHFQFLLGAVLHFRLRQMFPILFNDIRDTRDTNRAENESMFIFFCGLP